MSDEGLDRGEHVHRAPWAGESAAFGKAAAQAPAMWAHILAELETAPAGITPDEYAQEFGKLINTVRRRFTDLWKAGHIRHHPEALHRPNAAGNPCVVWVLGADPECGARRTAAKPPRAPPLPDGVIVRLAPASLNAIEAICFARALEEAIAAQAVATGGELSHVRT